MIRVSNRQIPTDVGLKNQFLSQIEASSLASRVECSKDTGSFSCDLNPGEHFARKET